MSMYKVLLPQPIHEAGIKLLEENGCEIIYPDNESVEEIKQKIAECEAALIRTTVINKEIIENAPNLKIIARHGIGLDNVDIDAATEHGVYVCNAPYSNVNSVAEHAVTLMAGLSHKILMADKAIRQGKFYVRNQYIKTELSNKTLGLIGLGNIGKLVAQKCHYGFGMDVIAYDPFVTEYDDSYIALESDVEQLLSEADIVSLHIPYIKELHHFISNDELQLMKNTSILINVARGGLVDEEALYNALDKGMIAGAGLDCFADEPTPADHPLFSLDNVILTPHMAAHSTEAMISMATVPAEEILRLKNNESLKFNVNLKRGV